MKTLAERVRSALDHAQKKPSWLAMEIGVTRSTVSFWLKGDSKSIKGENLARAAVALAVNPHWLATGDGPREPAHTAFHAMKEPSAEYRVVREDKNLIAALNKLPSSVQNTLRTLIFDLAKSLK